MLKNCITKITTLAVVGAGPAGLCVAKHALANSFKPTVFEQTGEIGGTWIYDENGDRSAMYGNLMTNIAKEIMGFMDFDFPSHLDSFISHEEVLSYLREYSRVHSLTPCIKLHSRVVRILPTPVQTWEIHVENQDGNITTHYFDAVAVCNGHHNIPRIPDIPNISSFKGSVIHSHSYRRPEIFSGKVVVCLGGGISGVDIGLDLATEASQVYLSHYNDLTKLEQLPENFHLVPNIISALTNGFVLSDGSHLKADALVLCTGYCYDFPFLTEECQLQLHEGVHPLYKHVININYPTMGFIGLPFLFLPFLLCDMQAKFFMASLNGSLKLPSKSEMIKVHEMVIKEFEATGMKPRHFLQFGQTQKEYFSDLALQIGSALPPVVFDICDWSLKRRNTQPTFFRDYNYTITGTDSFVESEVEKKTSD